MVAYKVWHDIKHFIHKDTTNELNVGWTEDITQAKDLPKSEAYTFFYGTLGFNEFKQYDTLRLI